jgi:hypothetical protein
MIRATLKATRHACRQFGRMPVYATILLSLWQAPVMWLHRHVDEVHASDALPRHLKEFHPASGDASADTSAGVWHVHLAFAEDIARGGGLPVEPDAPEGQQTPCRAIKLLVSTSTCVLTEGVAVAPVAYSVTEGLSSCLVTLNTCPDEAPTHQPLAAFLTQHRLLPLLCIARC